MEEEKIKIEYYETSIDSIIRYYVEGFTTKKILNYESNIDSRTGKVILKLLITDNLD